MSQPEIASGIKLLRNPNVLIIFIAYMVTFMGTAMAPIAMAFGVLDLTGSTKDASIVIAAPIVATLVILLFGGTVADRGSRQKIIVAAELVAMVIQFGIAYLFLSGNATVLSLALLMLLNGAAMAFNAPAASAFVTQLVTKDELQSVNALLGLARNGAMIGGAALGGVLVAWVGAGVTILIDAISFGFSAVLVWTLKPNAQVKPEKSSFIQDLKLGWNEFTSHRWIWVIVLQFSFVVAALESVFALLGPAVARSQLGGPVDWGFIAGGLGAGTVLGGILAFKLKPQYPLRLATISVLFFSLLPLGLAVPLPVFWIVFLAFISGIALEIFGVIWVTTLQRKIPGHLLSRVTAYDYIGSISLAPMGIVAAGFLYETMGSTQVLVLAALIILIPTVLTLFVKEVWNMQNDH